MVSQINENKRNELNEVPSCRKNSIDSCFIRKKEYEKEAAGISQGSLWSGCLALELVYLGNLKLTISGHSYVKQ